MVKLLFYIILSLLIASILFLLPKIVDYTIENNIVRDYIPKSIRTLFLDRYISEKVFKKVFTEKIDTVIVGTSHVGRGFSDNYNKVVKVASPGIVQKDIINISNIILSESNIKNLIIELSPNVFLMNRNNGFLNVKDEISYILKNLFENIFRINKVDYFSIGSNIHDLNQLGFPKEYLTLIDIEKMNHHFQETETLLNSLIYNCSKSNKGINITLVSLPLHSKLLKKEKINPLFESFEINVQRYLKKLIIDVK